MSKELNPVLVKHFSDLVSSVDIKLKNNFVVSDFMVETKLDFLYAIKNENEAILLNVDVFGTTSMKDVAKLAKEKRVALIHEPSMEMYVYNVPEEEVIEVLFNQ